MNEGYTIEKKTQKFVSSAGAGVRFISEGILKVRILFPGVILYEKSLGTAAKKIVGPLPE